LSYQWYFDGNIIPNSNQASYNATLSGNYTLQVTSNAGCTNLASGVISLKKYKKPIVDFDFISGCNAPIIFANHSDTSMSGQVNWLWNFGDGSQSTDYNPTHNYISGNTYSVSLSATPIKCPNLYMASNHIVIAPINPSGIRYRTVDALINTNTLLEARSGATNYLWSPSTGLNNINIQSPIFNHNAQVEYLIRLNYPGGCSAVDTLLVRVQRAINIEVPKAFSPNGDNHNDYLEIFLVGIKELRFFRVFNRWGQLLFETNDIRQLWDGTYKGKRQPAETYVWIAEGIDDNGKSVIRRGQTILLR
jgi:gliding motility-associated-like protein